jgi:hypothetical protein
MDIGTRMGEPQERKPGAKTLEKHAQSKPRQQASWGMARVLPPQELRALLGIGEETPGGFPRGRSPRKWSILLDGQVPGGQWGNPEVWEIYPEMTETQGFQTERKKWRVRLRGASPMEEAPKAMAWGKGALPGENSRYKPPIKGGGDSNCTPWVRFVHS